MWKWPLVPLAEVAEVNPRGLPDFSDEAEVSFVPMAAVDEVAAALRLSETRPIAAVRKGFTPFRECDVLFAKITPCMENGKSAIARGLVGGIGFGSTEFHVIRPSRGIMPEWILAFVRRPEYRVAAKANFTGSAGQQRVPAVFLKRSMIPVPPLAEQERIVRILDEAEDLRRLRREADRRTADLIPALFHEMFGPAAMGRSKWPVTSVSELAVRREGSIRTGPFGSDLRHSEFVAEGIPVLGIENVVRNEFRWTGPRCVPPERYESLKRFRVLPRDVLITIMGTVGRCCVAPDDLPVAISTKHLCVISIREDVANPHFIWGALLFDPEVRGQTRLVGSGAIMEGWNMSIVRRLRLRLPSLERQREFAVRVADIRAMEERQAESRRGLDDLAASLLHRAFARKV